jgi:hypothetical protein
LNVTLAELEPLELTEPEVEPETAAKALLPPLAVAEPNRNEDEVWAKAAPLKRMAADAVTKNLLMNPPVMETTGGG